MNLFSKFNRIWPFLLPPDAMEVGLQGLQRNFNPQVEWTRVSRICTNRAKKFGIIERGEWDLPSRSIQHKSSLKNYKSWVDLRSWGRREPPPPPLFLPAPPPLLPGGVTGGEGWAEPVNPGQGATARGTGGTRYVYRRRLWRYRHVSSSQPCPRRCWPGWIPPLTQALSCDVYL
jgi:hypothetical protein